MWYPVSTHSRPKAAARANAPDYWARHVSTHSSPKAAAYNERNTQHHCCFNTQPRGGGCNILVVRKNAEGKFQHTAARRRLLDLDKSEYVPAVSTHSRAEAAASRKLVLVLVACVSTHSPPKAAALEGIYK